MRSFKLVVFLAALVAALILVPASAGTNVDRYDDVTLPVENPCTGEIVMVTASFHVRNSVTGAFQFLMSKATTEDGTPVVYNYAGVSPRVFRVIFHVGDDPVYTEMQLFIFDKDGNLTRYRANLVCR